MFVIKRKALLVAAPVPPFVGTRLGICLTEPSEGRYVFGIWNGVLAEGRTAVTVDWGDGSRQEAAGIGGLVHEYAAPGEYEVRLSDDLESLVALRASDVAGFPATLIRREIVSFISNARRLKTIGKACFNKAANLAAVDLGDSAVESLIAGAFGDCESLRGELELRPVTSLALNTFTGTPGPLVFHFAKANEEIVRTLSGYPTFGAMTASCRFDR